MKDGNLFIAIILLCFSVVISYAQAIVQITPEEIQSTIMENSTFEKELILLDVRNDDEVVLGIIATEFCRPYHASWDYDWNDKWMDLPKDIPIIIICRSGNRANQAAASLVAKGYDINKIAVMKGGMNSYKGQKTSDSSLIKPWSDLPESSNSVALSNSEHNAYSKGLAQKGISEIERNQFNLKGQKINKTLVNPKAPVFILERIGETSRKKVTGIHRLIQYD